MRSNYDFYEQTLISLTFLKNLSSHRTIPEIAVWWSFGLMDKANEVVSLGISSGELTDLKSLVPVCTIVRSGLFSSQNIHVSWLYYEFPEMASQELCYGSYRSM